MEDQEHLGRPSADALHLRQHLDDGVVVQVLEVVEPRANDVEAHALSHAREEERDQLAQLLTRLYQIPRPE